MLLQVQVFGEKDENKTEVLDRLLKTVVDDPELSHDLEIEFDNQNHLEAFSIYNLKLKKGE